MMNERASWCYPKIIVLSLLLATCWPVLASGNNPTQASTDGAQSYMADGSLLFPSDYRDWPFLTSGLDMNYAAQPMPPSHHMFDNVFVDPASVKAFRATGTWPDGTVFVKEARGARTDGSINKAGQFQDEDVMAVELHVKNSKRYQGSWAFFDFDGVAPAKPISKEEDGCSACHQQHGAVDNTFVQFYPTLIGIARSKGTLSASYLKESIAPLK